jgi:hypothetical protein
MAVVSNFRIQNTTTISGTFVAPGRRLTDESALVLCNGMNLDPSFTISRRCAGLLQCQDSSCENLGALHELCLTAQGSAVLSLVGAAGPTAV